MLTKFTRFSEDVAKFYICEIILALESLHQKEIIFRDLKPDNVVIDSRGRIKYNIYPPKTPDSRTSDYRRRG
jgi:serine/threonine protein kinase